MSSIFISYRRTDAGAWAGRLADTLKGHLGGVQIFRDIEDIPPGVEFDTYIFNAVGSCEALIALMGRGWLNAADKDGERRLDDPEDFTRLEIVAALKRNVRVVPVLVDGALMPSREELPDDLKPLARRQAYELTDKHWANDCRRLADVLGPLIGKTAWTYKTVAIGAGAIAAVCIGAFAWWQQARTVDTPQDAAMQTRTVPASAPSVAGASAPAVKDRRWPNGSTLTVDFVGGKAQDRETVKRHAKQWSSYANIDFDFVAPGRRAEVRIAFDPSGGNWSYVGTDSKTMAKADQPTMNLAFVDEPTVLHQFGHVLGLLHEHQNPNARFDWNTDLMTKEMGWDRATLDVNVTRRYSPSDYVIPKPFDPYSVMLYTFPASWTNGVVLNQGRVLSETDKDYVSKIYPGRWRSGK